MKFFILILTMLVLQGCVGHYFYIESDVFDTGSVATAVCENNSRLAFDLSATQNNQYELEANSYSYQTETGAFRTGHNCNYRNR